MSSLDQYFGQRLRGFGAIRVASFVAAVVGAVSLTLALVLSGIGDWHVVALLALVAFVAEGRPMRVSSAVELAVSFIPIIMAAVLFGPGAGALVGVIGMLGDRGGPWEKWVIYTSDRAVSGVVAGIAAGLVTGAWSSTSLPSLLAASAAAAAGLAVVDFTVNMLTARLRKNLHAIDVWRLLRGSLGLTFALYTPLTALYAYAYLGAGVLVTGFIAIPLLAAHLSHSMFARQAQLIEQLTSANARLEDANRRLRRVNLSFARAMVTSLDARDHWTAGHSVAVAVYSSDIARETGMGADQVELVHLTGLVHDIGKIGVPAEVLQKVTALDDGEWAQMRRHSEIGANILIEVEDYADVARIVRSHHERFDGAGYPDGLARDEIPLLARVIAVADSYNAMTSDRPYRRAMSPDVAIQQLLNGRGSQFQADLVDAFVRVLKRESDSYRRGLLADFSLESMQHPALMSPPVLRAAV
jgi:putative nucleotidyltransferase with HDIG domain